MINVRIHPVCAVCGGLMLWDGDLDAHKCVACGRPSYPLVPGATLPRLGPPSGHMGIDYQRRKPIADRATPGGKMVGPGD